uniref:Dynein heavy chain 10, axonemal n=2 Tax=Cacopsylla melanoneura TaxID=428564 RepID=A0A8D8RUJ9_9HEMI
MNVTEHEVFLRAVRSITLAQLVSEDVPVFSGLLRELLSGMVKDIKDFPKETFDRVASSMRLISVLSFTGASHPRFTSTLNEVLVEDKLDTVPAVRDKQRDKIYQLYESTKVGHCTMVVGPTSGGKSTIIATLVKTGIAMGVQTQVYPLNPKSLPIKELYGVLDPITQFWTEGVLSYIFRQMNIPGSYETTDSQRPSGDTIPGTEPLCQDNRSSLFSTLSETRQLRNYIVLDGDLDEVWLENMNSVLDESKTLCLPNGGRTELVHHCRILFEIPHLHHCSPSTISRCGIVYVDPSTLGIEPYWARWLSLNVKPENGEERLEFKNRLNGLFVKYVSSCLSLFTHRRIPLQTVIPMTPLNMIVQLCTILKYNLDGYFAGCISPEETEAVFIFSLYCSLGAVLNAEAQIVFDEHVKELSEFETVKDNEEKIAAYNEIPSKEPTWYSYTLNRGNSPSPGWVLWSSRVNEYEHSPGIEFSEMFVPTMESGKLMWLLNAMHERRRPCLVVGDTGSTQTTTIQYYLRSLKQNSKKHYSQLTVPFTSFTTSRDMLLALESAVNKDTRDRELLLFIDDVNLPKCDGFGTQEPIAFLKFLIENGGCFGRDKNLNWRSFKNTSYFSAVNTPLHHAHLSLDPRFLSLFSIIYTNPLSDSTLVRIYGSILSGHWTQFEEDIRTSVPDIVEMTVDLYKIALAELHPTPAKFQYWLSTRDLSRLTRRLLSITPKLFNTVGTVLRAWRNEFERAVCNRLHTQEDQLLMNGHITEALTKWFPGHVNTVMKDPLVMGELGYEDYQDMGDYSAIENYFVKMQNEYNSFKPIQGPTLDLVLFEDMLQHLYRLYRTLRKPNSHCMLLGLEGEGKRSLVGLATFAAGRKFIKLDNCRVDNLTQFRQDLKAMFKTVVHEKETKVIVIKEHEITNDGCLDLINSIITLGVPPSLYTYKEKQVICSGVKGIIDSDQGIEQMKQTLVQEDPTLCQNEMNLTVKAMIKNLMEETLEEEYQTSDVIPSVCAEEDKTKLITLEDDSGENEESEAWKYFVSQVAANVHVVFCASPTSDTLRSRCRNFPALYNNTYINRIPPWSHDALLAVATKFIEPSTLLPEDLKPSIIEHLLFTHASISQFVEEYQRVLNRYAFFSFKHYLSFVKSFIKMIEQKLQTRSTDGYSIQQKINLLGAAIDIVSRQQGLDNLDSMLELEGSEASFTENPITGTPITENPMTAIKVEELIEMLGPVRVRWGEELATLVTTRTNAVGACLLGAGFMVYASPFSQEFRNRMIYDTWQTHLVDASIPIDSEFLVEEFLCGDDFERRHLNTWRSDELSLDQFSIQNALLVTKGNRFPLCIDPEGRAINWILNREKTNHLKVASFSDTDWYRLLIEAMKYGHTFVINDVESVDPIIEVVLEKNIIQKKGPCSVFLGSTECAYNPGFRLYLTTRKSYSTFKSWVFNKAMVIDFSMTPEALEEMFLSRTIEKETDYEEQYERSLAAVRSNKQNYSTFNKHVMTELTRANVWNKNAALDNIKKNLEKCKEAKDKLLEAESIVATLAPMRDLYRPIAKRAVILYQARKDMTKVNHMYQFSLERFIDKVFPNSFDPSQNSIQNMSMQSAQSIDKETEQIEQDQDYELNQRLISVVDSLTVNCYKHICLVV